MKPIVIDGFESGEIGIFLRGNSDTYFVGKYDCGIIRILEKKEPPTIVMFEPVCAIIARTIKQIKKDNPERFVSKPVFHTEGEGYKEFIKLIT